LAGELNQDRQVAPGKKGIIMKRTLLVILVSFSLVGCTSKSQLKRKSVGDPFSGGAGELVLQSGEMITARKILFTDTGVILPGKIKQRGSSAVARENNEALVLTYDQISEVRLKQESDATAFAFAGGTLFGVTVLPYLIYIPLALAFGGFGY